MTAYLLGLATLPALVLIGLVLLRASDWIQGHVVSVGLVQPGSKASTFRRGWTLDPSRPRRDTLVWLSRNRKVMIYMRLPFDVPL